jgi:hypothetical protein
MIDFQAAFLLMSVLFSLSIFLSFRICIRYRAGIKTLEEEKAELCVVDVQLRGAIRLLNEQVPREDQVTEVDYYYNNKKLTVHPSLLTASAVMKQVGPCYLHEDAKELVIVLPCTPYHIRQYGRVCVGTSANSVDNRYFWTIETIEMIVK